MTKRATAYPITQLTGGLDVSIDALLLTDSKNPNLNNVRFFKGILYKEKGFSAFGSVSERPLLFYNYKQFDGDIINVCLTVDHLYTESGGVWSEHADSTASPFTGSDADMFRATTFNDVMYMTNGVDYVYTYDGTNVAEDANLNASGLNVKCKDIIAFHNCLFLLSTIETAVACPLRVRYCAPGDPTDWDGVNAGAFDLADTPDHVICGVVLGDRLLIFKEESIWEVYYVGSTEKMFDAKLVVPNIGTQIPHSVQVIGGMVIFYGSNSFYTFDGSNITDIGTGVRDLIFRAETSVVNITFVGRSPATYIPELKQYIIVIPTTTANPTLMLKYHVDEGAWVCQDNSAAATALGVHGSAAAVSWANATGAWEDASWAYPWSNFTSAMGVKNMILGKSAGGVYKDDKFTTSNELMTWESKDFNFGHASRIVELRYQVKGDSFYSSYSTDEGLSWSNERLLTPSSNSYFGEANHYVNVTTQKLRMRARTYNANFAMEWAEPWYIDRAKSK